MKLIQTLANLENLRNKLATEVAPGRELYEEREWELLEYATELWADQTLNMLAKIHYDKEYTIECAKFKEWKEKVSDAETKRAVDFLLLTKETDYKTQEAILQWHQKQYDAYRRFSENILKARLIWEMSDMKRQDIFVKSPGENNMPF